MSTRTVPLLQAVAGKCRFADELRVLQPSTSFRASGVATQHPFYGWFCNPTLLSGLRVLQPSTLLRALGFCHPALLLRLRVLQPSTLFRA